MIFYYCPIRGLQYSYQNPLIININCVPSDFEMDSLMYYLKSMGMMIVDSKRPEPWSKEVNTIWSNF